MIGQLLRRGQTDSRSIHKCGNRRLIDAGILRQLVEGNTGFPDCRSQ